MTYEEVMEQLRELGSEQTKQTWIRHGAKDPLYGVKVGDLKKLVKAVKKDQQLAHALYESGNSDAMYLAGLTVDPKTVAKETLQQWVKQAYWYLLAEYTVAGLAADSPYGRELALEWIESPEEFIADCGWSTYANWLAVTPDVQLDEAEIRQLLDRVRTTIHQERNRVRYAMNGFLISVGAYYLPLKEAAEQAAREVGPVAVDMGGTACKVPLASEYIEKVDARGKAGVKKKTSIC